MPSLNIPSTLEAVGAGHPAELTFWVRVALDVPVQGLFDYCSATSIPLGTRVIVPFGRRKLIGVVVATPAQPAIDPSLAKAVEEVLDDTPPLPADRSEERSVGQ